MHVFVAYLHEDRTGVGKQIARDRKAVAQIGEIAMDAIAPRITKGFDLFRLAGDVAYFTSRLVVDH